MQSIVSGAHIPTPVHMEYEFGERPILAYLVNTGMLGQRVVRGVWVPFPATAEGIRSALDGIGIDDGQFQTWFVAQYITDISGLADCLPVCPDLNALNFLAHTIRNMECEEMELFEAAIERGCHEEIGDLLDLAFCLDSYEYIPGVYDDEELGRWCVESFDFCDVPGIGEFLNHIDREAYGRKKRESERGEFVDSGYIAAVEYTEALYSDSEPIPPEYKII